MDRNLRLLACQIEIPRVVSKEQKTDHLKIVVKKIINHLAESSKSVDLIVLPELSTIDYSRASFEQLDQLSEPLDGESFMIFSHLAKTHGAFISYGMPRVENGNYYISQVIVDDKGKYVGHYDKLHMAQFGASMEKEYFQRGKELVTFDVKGIRIAPVICYDLRFPELYRELCYARGVELIIHSVAFYNDESYPSWHHFAITRAMENQVYFLSLNRAGKDYGSSIYCPPWIDHNIKPTVLPKDETFTIFEVDGNILKQACEIFPFQADMLESYTNFD